MPITHADLPAPLGPPSRGPGVPKMPPGHETDTLAGRLRWSAAGVALLLADAAVPFVAWRVLAMGADAPAVVWFGGVLECGLVLSTMMVAHRLWLAWKQERHVIYAWQDYIDVTIDKDADYWDALFDTQAAYTKHYYRAPKQRQVRQIDGRLMDVDTGEILAPDGRWYATGEQPAASEEPAPDTAGGGIVATLRDRVAGRTTEQKTQPLGLPPAPPALSAPASKFLAAIVHGNAYGMRRLVPAEMTRPQYDVVVAAFVASGLLFKDAGQTFRVAPELDRWRAQWLDTAGLPADEQMARRQEIDRAAHYWARAKLAGIVPGEHARLAG